MSPRRTLVGRTKSVPWTAGWLAALAMVTACGQRGDSAWGLIWSLGSSLVLGGLWWGVLAALLGLVLSIPIFRILTRMGAFGDQGRFTRFVRFLVLLSLIVAFPLIFASIGFFEGILRASTHQLLDGRVARQIYPTLGSAGADLIGQLVLDADETSAPDASEAFRSGALQLETARVPQVLAALHDDVIEATARDVRESARRRFPWIAAGRGEQIFDWFLGQSVAALERYSLGEEAGEAEPDGVSGLFSGVLARLPEAAAGDGDPRRLSHAELSGFLVESTLADAVLRLVVRPFCRSQQAVAALLLLVCLGVPVFLLRGLPAAARWLARQRG